MTPGPVIIMEVGVIVMLNVEEVNVILYTLCNLVNKYLTRLLCSDIQWESKKVKVL